MALQYAKRNDRSCIEVRGADAAAFLHGQLTQSLLAQDPHAAPLAAWADARGRVRALFRVVAEPDRWLLVTPRSGADALVQKLRMFVLRSKVTVAQARDVAVGALLGDAAALAAHGVDIDLPPNRAVRRDGLCFVRVTTGCWQVVGAGAALEQLRASFDSADEAAAARAEIALGIPEIAPAVAERFVAQMLNLDALGALAFDKGCYPGQEIIARVHNLGGVKRRARRYSIAGAPPPPAEPVTANGEPVGEVVCAAAAADGAELLAVVEHAATGAPLECRGARLEELPLPFALPPD